MYINQRSQLVRNITLAVANGSLTLIILLIAPLGLAAVIINTILITISTFITATASDRVIKYLQPHQHPPNANFPPPADSRETANLSNRNHHHSQLRR
jgi:cell division protein FtsW (lipid II flippase)